MLEEWRYIRGYEDRYAVSNYGNVYSYVSNSYLIPILRNDGYYAINLHKSGKQKTFLLHRIVLDSFQGPAPNDEYEAAHYPDPTKSNNRSDNLMWCLHAENEHHKSDRLSVNDVIKVKNALIKYKDYKTVSKMFNLHIMVVNYIGIGRTYSNIGPDMTQYNFDKRIRKDPKLIHDLKQAIFEQNMSCCDAMKKFKINRSYYYRIKNKELHKDDDIV